MKKRYITVLQLERRPRTKQEIACILKISYSTLRRRLRESELNGSKRLLNLSDQESILQIFDYKPSWL